MSVVIGRNLPEIINDPLWNVDVVDVETEIEWVWIVADGCSETDEGRGIRDERGHLEIGNVVDVVLVELFFQHAAVRGILGTNE
ncbi:hypothetical protein GCM10009066_10150 [Halarchaeum salinum]|uniref:Uncharacterized protein n=1 Tax=Halarchaeum salinum TaxID=489912 RepID=A0AAV3S6K7_9EURY